MSLILSGTNGLSDVDGTAATPAIRGTDANTGIFFPAADTIAFSEGGVESMRLDSAGNVGIGTSSPTALRTKNLEVSSGGTNDSAAVIANKRGTGVATFRAATVGGADGFDINYNFPNTGMLSFFDLAASATRVAIDSSGNVGIGTSSPVGKVDIIGATNVYALKVGDGTRSGGLIPSSTGGIALYTPDTTPLSFWTNNTERARIDSSGNLLVGTTTTQQGGRFSIANTVNNVCVGMYASGTGNTTGTYLNCGDDFAIRFRVYTNGNVQNANNSYGSTSDIKLKENIVDATPKLEKLNQIRIVNYNLIGQEQKQIGVIAQELEQIFPGMIDESPDRDKDGNDLGTTTKSVKYSVFVPMLIKAIQEQQAIIESLTARVAQLEAK